MMVLVRRSSHSRDQGGVQCSKFPSIVSSIVNWHTNIGGIRMGTYLCPALRGLKDVGERRRSDSDYRTRPWQKLDQAPLKPWTKHEPCSLDSTESNDAVGK